MEIQKIFKPLKNVVQFILTPLNGTTWMIIPYRFLSEKHILFLVKFSMKRKLLISDWFYCLFSSMGEAFSTCRVCFGDAHVFSSWSLTYFPKWKTLHPPLLCNARKIPQFFSSVSSGEELWVKHLSVLLRHCHLVLCRKKTTAFKKALDIWISTPILKVYSWKQRQPFQIHPIQK